VFLHLLKAKGQEQDWTVDSAAIGSWHVGGDPDSRAMKVLKSKGVEYDHTVRQVTLSRLQIYLGLSMIGDFVCTVTRRAGCIYVLDEF